MTTTAGIGIHVEPSEISHRYHPAGKDAGKYGTLDFGRPGNGAYGHLFFETDDAIAVIDAVIAELVALRAEMDPPVITDSGRTCPEANPGSGAWCHRDGDHGVHEDTDGQTWRTDGLRCECSHAQDEHDDADDSDAGRAPRECLRPGCGCGRYRLAAPSPHAEPPAVVNGDVVLEVRALLS